MSDKKILYLIIGNTKDNTVLAEYPSSKAQVRILKIRQVKMLKRFS